MVGDCALKALVDCVRSCMRESDMAFRYGGEEFTLVLSNTGLDGAVLLAERIRRSVEEMTVRCFDLTLKLTCSLGVASLKPEQDAELLLRTADEALYHSKTRGRNRVTALAAITPAEEN
jgi:diguanylate cyclase (GGDEF)-like protein